MVGIDYWNPHKVVINLCRRIRRSSKIIITFGNSTTWHFLVLHASIFVYWTAAVHKNCLWPLTYYWEEDVCVTTLLHKITKILLNENYFIPQHLWPNLCQIDDSVIGQGVLKFIHTWRMYIVWFVTKTWETRQQINTYSREKKTTHTQRCSSRSSSNVVVVHNILFYSVFFCDSYKVMAKSCYAR